MPTRSWPKSTARNLVLNCRTQDTRQREKGALSPKPPSPQTESVRQPARFTITVKGIPLTAQSEPVYSVGTPEVCFQPEEPKVFVRPLANSRLSSSGRADEQSNRHAMRLHPNAATRGTSRST